MKNASHIFPVQNLKTKRSLVATLSVKFIKGEAPQVWKAVGPSQTMHCFTWWPPGGRRDTGRRDVFGRAQCGHMGAGGAAARPPPATGHPPFAGACGRSALGVGGGAAHEAVSLWCCLLRFTETHTRLCEMCGMRASILSANNLLNEREWNPNALRASGGGRDTCGVLVCVVLTYTNVY